MHTRAASSCFVHTIQYSVAAAVVPATHLFSANSPWSLLFTLRRTPRNNFLHMFAPTCVCARAFPPTNEGGLPLVLVGGDFVGFPCTSVFFCWSERQTTPFLLPWSWKVNENRLGISQVDDARPEANDYECLHKNHYFCRRSCFNKVKPTIL